MLATFAVVAITASCTSDSDWLGMPGQSGKTTLTSIPRPGEIELVSAKNCRQLADNVRPAIAARADALAEMDRSGDIYKADMSSGSDQPTTADSNSIAGATSSGSRSESASSAEAGSGDASGASDRVVGTNVQEIGVDEADFVKADSERIVTITNGVLRAIALDGTPQIDGTLDLPDTQSVAEMYLLGDEALVLDSLYTARFDTASGARFGAGGDASVAEPAVGAVAGEMMVGQGPATRLTRVDLGDLGSPRIVQSVVVEGSLTASRAIDSTVRIVLRGDALPIDQISGASTPDDLTGIAENINGEELLPRVIDDTGEVRPISACSDVMVQAESTSGNSLPVNVTVLSVKRTLDDLHPVTVQGSAETVYASTDALVVAGSGWSQAGSFTTLHRFDLSAGDKARPTGSGVVAGSLLNQFALSERSGAIRVVTTVDNASVAGNSNRTDISVAGTSASLAILDADSPDLAQLSRVDGLGPGETVQSVRFMDSVAYVVTFRQTDPLYAIDLSDPKAPRNLGELKVTGFSEYMHPVGEGLLIGVGREVDPATGSDLGLKISLFDVSDPAAMSEVDKMVVPFAYSPVGDDHRAFTWDSVNNHAIFPIEGSCPSVAPVDPAPGDPIPADPMPSDPMPVEPMPTEPGRAVEAERAVCMSRSAALVVGVSDNKLARVAELSHKRDGSWAGIPTRSLIVGENLWTVSDLGVARTDAAKPGNGGLISY